MSHQRIVGKGCRRVSAGHMANACHIFDVIFVLVATRLFWLLEILFKGAIMQSNTQAPLTSASAIRADPLASEWFRIGDVPEGSARSVGNVAVFNVSGHLRATQAKCPHQQGPLTEGHVTGSAVTCPWHGSQFDVCSGAVLRGPAVTPLQTYTVVVEGEMARVESIQNQDAK